MGAKKFQLTDDERRNYEQKIDELTRANDKCSQYIIKREHEQRSREKTSLNIQQIDETKRKYNDEIHRLYDQVKQKTNKFCLLLFIFLFILDRKTKSTTIDFN